MKKPESIFHKLLETITASCGAIASYSVVVLIILFFPIRSATVHNKHHELAEKIFIPIACLLTILCCFQIYLYFLEFTAGLNGKKQKIFFKLISVIILFSLCFISIGMLYYSVQQLNAM